ncbi:MAG: hypothetical protein IPM77_03845 [Crocinitomicaceae bacterium]|nr:hypothetical protein [Crocinitomicaceae bacterium]
MNFRNAYFLIAAVSFMTSCGTSFYNQKYTSLKSNQKSETIYTENSTDLSEGSHSKSDTTQKETMFHQFQREVLTKTLDSNHFIHHVSLPSVQTKQSHTLSQKTIQKTTENKSERKSYKTFQKNKNKMKEQKSKGKSFSFSVLEIVLILVLIVVAVFAIACAYIIWLLLFSWW